MIQLSLTLAQTLRKLSAVDTRSGRMKTRREAVVMDTTQSINSESRSQPAGDLPTAHLIHYITLSPRSHRSPHLHLPIFNCFISILSLNTTTSASKILAGATIKSLFISKNMPHYLRTITNKYIDKKSLCNFLDDFFHILRHHCKR